MDLALEWLKSFPPFAAAAANMGLVAWGAIGIALAIPLELIVRGARSSRPDRWWKVLLAIVARVVIGFVAFTSTIGTIPSTSLFALIAGLVAYIGTIWIVRVLVAIEIFLELLIEMARRRLGEDDDSDGGRLASAPAAGGVPQQGGRSPRLGWRDILGV
jgi:hypothetical protein